MTSQNAKKTLLPHKIGDTHIRLLRIYKTVIESGGFASAEIELNISRPAISLAISELESLLDMRLCHRGRAGFSVTNEGETVYQAALQLLGSLETFKSQVNAINRELKGEFNIGITDNLATIPQMYISRALTKLKNRGPEIIVNIRMIPPKDIETAVIDGQLHIGVVPDLRALSGLNYIPLYKEKSLLYCSKEHPLFSKDNTKLSSEQLAEFDAVLPAYPQAAEIKQQQKKLRATATSTDREGIAFLILTGHYIGFLPTHFAERWVKDDLMVAIQPEQNNFITHYSAIVRKGARTNLILESYLEELNSTLK
ncbi:LysR family transcriptional regulator [Cocleimonas flava]|jgi:DNA-binding transcriptional LysR family regulator|uniref:LysR family transcriptional regulator n=1 Tax=Cocleimonas flava TaxID=634765 RepID=A0A4R1EW81_9GAMM|nr:MULTISPECIES: LysR family transcriptional regulator [Cocleimonas]MEB8433386.1 LysR family transcriptional regulator [Cocleimonas sp. KMM 6892]MEC4716197.1 LysR family transcriptional regulator [Cocleimonas sp. KMM 6895]MEC4745910.1 LysR family transcriptional regulator [Cocleimonas sp. KMM 6896]TCJ85030.1 LysR family transcriptional regulator [Cocleimonas flava]